MNIKIPDNWSSFLEKEINKKYFIDLQRKLDSEYNNHTIYPSQEDVFQALELTPLDSVKIVILGQDPYHQPGQAHGLSFSVKKGVAIPKSLHNIYRELVDDIDGFSKPSHGNLEKWAKQGVLLLNAVLTVRKDEPNSHKDYGWEQFTDAIIAKLGKSEKPTVFILWGKNAQAKEKLIGTHHLIIKSAHPSPLSAYRGFLGSQPFSKANGFLCSNGLDEIDWCLA